MYICTNCYIATCSEATDWIFRQSTKYACNKYLFSCLQNELTSIGNTLWSRLKFEFCLLGQSWRSIHSGNLPSWWFGWAKIVKNICFKTVFKSLNFCCHHFNSSFAYSISKWHQDSNCCFQILPLINFNSRQYFEDYSSTKSVSVSYWILVSNLTLFFTFNLINFIFCYSFTRQTISIQQTMTIRMCVHFERTTQNSNFIKTWFHLVLHLPLVCNYLLDCKVSPYHRGPLWFFFYSDFNHILKKCPPIVV